MFFMFFFFFSSRRRHTRLQGDWSSDVCSSDLSARSLRSRGELRTLSGSLLHTPSLIEISRISKVPPSYGARLSHSRASSIERTCHSQYPATSSLVSANGPSITVRFLPLN